MLKKQVKKIIIYEKVNEQSRKRYYKHQIEINETRREQYNENKDKVNDRRRELYINDKDEFSEKRKDQIECECGSVTRKADMSKHLKTKKHHNHTITATHRTLQPITTA